MSDTLLKEVAGMFELYGNFVWVDHKIKICIKCWHFAWEDFHIFTNFLLSIGSSNSQDSFPAAGSNSSSMDGFSNGPHVGAGPGGVPGPYPQYPPSSEYPGHMPQRPPSQSTSGKSLQASFEGCLDVSLRVMRWWWEVKYVLALRIMNVLCSWTEWETGLCCHSCLLSSYHVTKKLQL